MTENGPASGSEKSKPTSGSDRSSHPSFTDNLKYTPSPLPPEPASGQRRPKPESVNRPSGGSAGKSGTQPISGTANRTAHTCGSPHGNR